MKKKNTTIKILIAEHDIHDLAMIDNELKKGGTDFVSEIVQNEAGYRKALKNFIPDIILCDYKFPSFDGPTAFKIKEQLAPETPFILVSGAIGEEYSIELIKNGVTDFVLKDKIFTLTTKLLRGLKEANERKEKNKIEQDYKQTAAHLAEAQSLAKLGSWDYDFADNKLTWSEQLYNVFDTNKQTFNETHGSFLHLIDEADREYVEKTSKHTQETGDAFIIEYGITTHKEEKRVIQEHGYGVKDETGEVIRLFGTAQDITERKKAEHAVKESEAKYRAFFENSMDGILLTVTDGNILAANPAACKIFNMKEQEICDAGRFGLVDLSDPRVEDLIKERQLTGKAQGELTFLRKDRTTFAGEISSVLFTDSFGQERTSMIIRDISARKESEEKHKESFALLRMAGKMAKLGGWNVNLEENRVYWSDEVAAIHEMPAGYAPLVEDAIEFYAPEWRDKITEVFTNCMQKGISYDEDTEILTATGKRIWVRTNGEAVRDQNGKIVKVHGTFQDITIRKNIELQLKKSNSSLTERVKEQNCLYEISNLKEHELSIEELLRKAVELIPPGFQFIEKAKAKIIWKGQAFKTDKFRNSKIKLTESGDRFGKKALQVAVHYVDTSQSIEEVSFLKEEKQLLKAIINQLSQKIELIVSSNERQRALNDLTKIMDSSLDVICAVDANGNFLKVSAASEAVWGYKPEELIGKPLINFVYHEDNEKTQLTAANVMTGKSLNHFENRYVRKDGSLVPIEWTARWDVKDQIRYGIARDITEKKRLEKAFEIERQQFFDLFSEAPTSMGVLSGPDHRFEMANPPYLKLIGKKDIIGKSVKDVLPEVAEQGFIDILDSVYRTGKTFSANELIIKLDIKNSGEPVDRYLNFLYQPHRDNDGKTDGILFFAVDVSEQVLSRKKIEESEARLKEAQALSHIGNWGIDITTGVNTWSDEFYKICGIKPGDIKPSSEGFLSFIHPEDAAYVKEAIHKTFETFVASHFYSRIFTRDGILKYVYSEWRFEMDENDNPIRLYGVLQDITERTLAKEKLELTQFTFDHASDAIFWMTSDARIVDVNEAACHSLGYTRQELLRLSVPDIDPDFNVETWSGFFPELRKKLTIPIETKQLRKDGSLIPVEIRANYIQYGNRELSCAFVRDISERKLTEAALIESQQEVRAIAESMPQIVWATTAEGKNIYLNQQWVDYTGLSLEVSYDDGWLIPFHEDDKPIPWEAWNNAVANQVEYNIECRLRKYDGTYHWYLLRGVPKMNEKGEILKWYGTCTDIEKIKQAENQIRKSEVFNRSVVNSLSAHLAVVNDKGDIVSINESWTNFALQNGETSMERTGVGSNYFEVCEKAFIEGDKIAGRVLQGMKNVLNKKIENFYLEYSCHSTSEQRWFGLRIAKFEGDEPLILLAHTNLTDRILAEREREKITDDLIQRNQELEQFTYIISHNLRAPVANIKGLLQWLEDDSLSKDDAEIVANGLSSSINKLDTVIIDLNHILQLKNGISGAKERVLFAELVDTIKESISSTIVQEDIKIITQFYEAPEMVTLKSYMYSIFYNLISNSIKYKKQDIPSVIDIRSHLKNDKIELIFKDNGRGIDLKKNVDQVFGLYKRFHREIDGKGMGLFMVKTQVEALGGKISIESEVDKGTEFKIVFTNDKKHGN
tara:strand:- start:2320 stop:7266 length:4947 start_codon:yes stop_codon:yes gene_type:complete